MENAVNKNKPLSLTDLLRKHFKGIVDPIGKFFNRLGVRPNTITFLGLVGSTIGAVLLAQGQMVLGGIVILIMGPVDALDGTMARLRGESSEFGAFVDSVTDRYSELVIMGGLLAYYLIEQNWTGAFLVYVAAVGSFLVSYVRARGQSLGFETKVGILTRVERYLVLGPSLVINQPLIGLGIIAVFANFTALQRILDVRRQAHASKNN